MKNLFKGGLILGLLLLALNSVKADIDIYIDDSSDNIGIVDLTTDKVTVIGNTHEPLHDIGFTANGNLYGVTQTALYSLSLTNADATLISNFPSSIGLSNMDSLVGDGNGLLAASGSTTNLYAIDVSPYAVTKLSGTTNGDSFGDLTFGPAGSSGPLYEALSNGYLDKITIAGTTITSVKIGNMGEDFNGLATVGGVTYGITGTEIYTINLTDAAVTPVFNYGGHGLGADSGAAALSSFVTVPEPGNVSMILSGILALAFFQLRKRARS